MSTELQPFEFEESFGDITKGQAIIEAALDERATALRLVKEILERFEQLNTLKRVPHNSPGGGYESIVYDLIDTISPYGEGFSTYEDKIMRKVDARFWLTTMDTSRLTAVMNTNKKDAMRNMVKKEAPIFERKIVYGTLSHYLETRMETFVAGAIEVFKTLNSAFKSNDQIRFRDRVIFNNALGTYGWNHYASGQDRIDDIERIMILLDGKDPSNRNADEFATYTIGHVYNGGQEEITTPYFRCNIYKNGNIHLWFTREDLVDKLNRLIAEHFGATLSKRESVRA